MTRKRWFAACAGAWFISACAPQPAGETAVATTPPPGAARFGDLSYEIIHEGQGSPASDGEATARLELILDIRDAAGVTHQAGVAQAFPLVINPALGGVGQLFAQMKKGAYWRLWVPAGASQPFDPGLDIGPAPHVWELRLVRPLRGPTPPQLFAPPPGAQATKTGIPWVRLADGNGALKPKEHDLVHLIVAVWSVEGELLDTPEWGRPYRTEAHNAPSVLPELLPEMTVNERRLVFLPAGASPEERPTVLDVTLVNVEEGRTEFVLSPRDKHHTRVFTPTKQTSLFVRGAKVEEVPELSPGQPPPR